MSFKNKKNIKNKNTCLKRYGVLSLPHNHIAKIKLCPSALNNCPSHSPLNTNWFWVGMGYLNLIMILEIEQLTYKQVNCIFTYVACYLVHVFASSSSFFCTRICFNLHVEGFISF